MASTQKNSPSQNHPSPGAQRLHKVLAHCGIGSRRACEQLIIEGRVEVNGKVVTKLGTKVDPTSDKLRVDGENVKMEARVYYLVYKPRGYISTSIDEMGRPRVIDLIPENRRIYAVGRLDEQSEGLMMLTNDGSVANVLCHPRYQVDKTYRLTVRGKVHPEQIGRIEKGVWLAEGRTAPAQIQKVQRTGTNTVVTVTIWEGRNRELRRMFAKVDLRVTHLLRTAIGPLKLDRSLPAGSYRKLNPKELGFVHERMKPTWSPSRDARPGAPEG